MNGIEMRREIDTHREEASRFIRWWRKENDFVDFELLGDFLHRLKGHEEFAGFELFDSEQMWSLLKDVSAGRVRRENRTQGAIIVWDHLDGSRQILKELPYNDESIMTIFDIETRGNTLQ